MKAIFLNFLFASLLFAGSDVDLFGSYEISVTLSGSVAESAYQYGGFVTITGDSGEAKGYSFVRHGFLDTATKLKFRVYVPFEGRYTYSATENYAGITISSGATGTFRCLNVDKTKYGMVRIDANNNFYTDDGNLFHPMFETAWNFTHWDIYKTLAQKKIWVDSCVAQNFNVMTIRAGASVSTTQTLNGEIPFAFGSTNYNLNTINLSWWAPADSIVLYTAKKGMVLAIALGFGDPLSSYPISELTKWFQMSKADLIHCIYFSRDPGATTFNFTDMTDTDGGRWYDVLTGTYGGFLAVGSGASESINPSAANQIFILKRKSYTAASIITVTQ